MGKYLQRDVEQNISGIPMMATDKWENMRFKLGFFSLLVGNKSRVGVESTLRLQCVRGNSLGKGFKNNTFKISAAK